MPQLLPVAPPVVATSLAALTSFVAERVDGGTAMVVADAAVVGNGYVDRVLAAVGGSVPTWVHTVPPGEPTAASVDELAAAARRIGPTAVVAVGGGSALDTGKLVANTWCSGRRVEEYALDARGLPQCSRLVAIPTTSGTGSEVTKTAVLTNSAGEKVWVWGEQLTPDLVVLDAEATVTVPPVVTSMTGLDAYVHAVEAATGRRGHESVRRFALAAVQLVERHLPVAVADGADLEARAGMQRAALLAGTAIDTGGTGIAHAIGHALGALGHVPHGAAVAAGLGAAMAWNVAGEPDAYQPIARRLGVPVGELPHRYAELLMSVAFPAVVRGIGALEVDAAELAATMDAPENRPMLENNCRLADDIDRLALAEATSALWDDLGRTSAR